MRQVPGWGAISWTTHLLFSLSTSGRYSYFSAQTFFLFSSLLHHVTPQCVMFRHLQLSTVLNTFIETEVVETTDKDSNLPLEYIKEALECPWFSYHHTCIHLRPFLSSSQALEKCWRFWDSYKAAFCTVFEALYQVLKLEKEAGTCSEDKSSALYEKEWSYFFAISLQCLLHFSLFINNKKLNWVL